MRVGRRQIDGFFGAEDLGALPHERHAAKDDDGLVARDRLLCQCKTVAHKICRRLHGIGRVIVCENERVPAGNLLTHPDVLLP